VRLGYDPSTNYFKSSDIYVYRFDGNKIVSDIPVQVIQPYLSTLPQFKDTISFFGKNLTHAYRIWKDDLKSQLYTIATRMVELEDKFIDLAFSMGAMENLTADDVKKYIRYIADRRLISLGLKGIFKIKKNPLPWVEEMINAPIHTNFFENRVTDYAKGALTGSWEDVWA
jgi:ribonucleoside-diphosphate reductase beta chain